jgi:hypothetical protein
MLPPGGRTGQLISPRWVENFLPTVTLNVEEILFNIKICL